MPAAAHAYVLEAFGTPLKATDRPRPTAGPGEAVVEVEGCGMCHTDLGFASGSVRPNHALPLVLGHEVVGRVVEVGDRVDAKLSGARVIVPAVMPCGDCPYCAAGRGNACPNQKMPGNDIDGGFATHLAAPAHALIPVEGAPGGVDPRALGIVADAVSTAYQAVLRAELRAGDVAFVVGAGGVGGFLTQIASAMGAKVVALDVDPGRLELIAGHGAHATELVKDRAPREIRKAVHGLAREWDIPSLRYRIFECSGSAAGQELAYGMLGRAATLVLVGYTFDKLTVRLSNLMAFDATVHGTWGCPPEAYADVLRLLEEGAITLEPFVEYGPMSKVNTYLDAMAAHELTRRVVLDPTA